MSAIDEIKQRVDIVELISRYTPLKKAGSTYKGLCPFHHERTPSFVVFPHTGTWHCFGACSTGGDVFTFLMKQEQLEFREALEMLARETGVSLESSQDESYRHRTTLYEVNAAAATYFTQILREHPAAQPARSYLERRGIDRATAEQFQLGYALDSWDSLRDHLSAAGYSLELQLEAGLVKRHEERESIYDAFRARVMIPIRDRQGRVIGFGGRVLDDRQPKYLNTGETPIFHKSRVVFGLDQAYRSIRERGMAVIVEGYMDVIAAHQHGFTNVVACMGTALTAEQLQQLQRYTDHFVLALDADSAGQQATIRGLNQARQALGRIRKPTFTAGGRLRLEERLSAHLAIASMPEGQDPDDVIRSDPARWQALIEQAQPLVDFYFQVVARQYDLTTARGKGSAVAELTPLIAELDDEIEQQHYIQQLSRLVQIDEMTIAGRVQAAARAILATSGKAAQPGEARRPAQPGWQPGQAGPPDGPPPQQAPRPELAQRGDVSEDYLLANLLLDPELLIWLAGATAEREIEPLRVEDLENVENREIFRALKQFLAGDEPWDLALFQESLTGHLHRRLAELLQYGAQLPNRNLEELQQDLLKVVVRMRLRRLQAEYTRIKFMLDEAQRMGDRDAVRELYSVNNRNLRERSHLEQTWVGLSRVLHAQGHPSQGVKVR